MDITFHDVGSLPDFVKLAKVIWRKADKAHPELLRNSGIIREMPIASHTGRTREFSEIEGAKFAPRKKEGAKAGKIKSIQGHTKTGYMYRIGGEKDITWELIEYGQYPEITEDLMSLGKTGKNRLALDLAHRIGFGTATTYTDQDGEVVDISCGDGKALFATDHVLKGTSSTVRNILNGNPAFSKSALQSMIEERRKNKKDHFGVSIPSNDNIIFSTQDEATVDAIEVLLNSRANTDDNKNSQVINRYGGRFRHTAIPYLDTDKDGVIDDNKAKYWGVADSECPEIILGMHKEPYLKTSLDGKNMTEDFHTDNVTMGVRGSWMIVNPGFKGIALSKGDGS